MWVEGLGDDQSEVVCRLPTKAARRLVGVIVELRDGAMYPFARLRRNAGGRDIVDNE